MFISLLTEEIRADILALEQETEGLLDEIVGEMLSREGAKGGDSSMNVEEVSSVVVDTAFYIWRPHCLLLPILPLM